MPLLKCPDCGGAVSTAAESCPHCGRPMTGTQDIVGGRRVQTVEKTAKKFKGWILGGTLAFFAGGILTVTGLCYMNTDSDSLGRKLLVVGVVVLASGLIAGAVAQALAWWHHG